MMRIANSASKTVLIIGGSYAGLAIAKALHGNAAFEVVIVERRGYCDINIASPRLLQDPDLASSVFQKLRRL
jgi:2-polyprenyl-6-methoxyphenol hydroxylase-like FAD-dependent oxidoreductase